MKYIRYLFLILAFTSFKRDPASAKKVAPPPGQQVKQVVFLKMAKNEENIKQEENYLTEMTLALEGIKLVSKSCPANFFEMNLARQIISIQKYFKDKHTIAVIWLNSSSDNITYLHMVVMHTKRALVRMLKADPQKRGFAVDLAMASKELLGEAYLFSKQKQQSKPLDSIVKTVKAKISPALPSKWTLAATSGLSGGIYGQTGTSLAVGPIISLRQRVFKQFKIRYSLQAKKGFISATPPLNIDETSIGAGLGISWNWKYTRFDFDLEFAPYLDLYSIWTNYEVETGFLISQNVSHWKPQINIGFEIKFTLLSWLELIVGLQTMAALKQQALYLQSSGKQTYASPFLLWQFQGGLCLFF